MLWGWLDHNWVHNWVNNTSIIHSNTSRHPILTPIPTPTLIPTCQCWVVMDHWVRGWGHRWELTHFRWGTQHNEDHSLPTPTNPSFPHNNNHTNKAKPNPHLLPPALTATQSLSNSNHHIIPSRLGHIMLNCYHQELNNNNNNKVTWSPTHSTHPTSQFISNSPNTNPIFHPAKAVQEVSILLGA